MFSQDSIAVLACCNASQTVFSARTQLGTARFTSFTFTPVSYNVQDFLGSSFKDSCNGQKSSIMQLPAPVFWIELWVHFPLRYLQINARDMLARSSFSWWLLQLL